MDGNYIAPKLLLEDLYLEMLDLIEQSVRCKVQLERHHNSGQMLLAKTRYIHGSQSIGAVQIPSEPVEFKALCTVVSDASSDESAYGQTASLRKTDANISTGHLDPIKWFLALPPRALRLASDHFKTCVELVVESANIQRELQTIIECISKLDRNNGKEQTWDVNT